MAGRPLRCAALAVALATAVAGSLASGCGGEDGAGPSTSLVGTWDFLGFTDAGLVGVGTGTAVFGADGTFTVNGTITYPDQPTEPFVAQGTYVQTGNTVVITTELALTWELVWSGEFVTLTRTEGGLLYEIRLHRRS